MASKLKSLAGNNRAQELYEEIKNSLRVQGDISPLIDATASVISTLDELSERVRLLEAMEAAFNVPLVKQNQELMSYSENIIITPEMIHLVTDGFYHLEYTNAGVPYRWTGANRGQFGWVLFLDRSVERTLCLELLAIGLAIEESVAELDFTLDGKAERTQREDGGDSVKYIAVISATEERTSTEVCFRTPVWQPRDLDSSSADARELGVAFKSLTIY